jgi:rhodanese-related sulfurtransferase
MQTITREELQNEIAAGAVVVLEALPHNYYADGHIPGALNLPLDDVEFRAAELVPDRDAAVVTYCTGTSCPNSRIAAEQLRKLGYTNVRAFEGGKEDWVQAGLLLESAELTA